MEGADIQTFVPHGENFARTARVLDNARLGKQRIEAAEILRINRLNKRSKWSRHPAARMWIGFDGALCLYGMAMCAEWINRGNQDTQYLFFFAHFGVEPYVLPPWLRMRRVYLSHRANLYRKDPVHYAQFKGLKAGNDYDVCCDGCRYFWPTHGDKSRKIKSS